ncbi:MAG: hypothetical protein PHO62_07870 [Sulfurimonas sp.]|uniref:hypothetical protein n=1 Tax=Sulfurimonas sp. TaxID=2022749 RepID=UPI0026327C2C|nr:hypothetical protein [Sulfurimonas sp.]MDD5373324.1 hypothetical protein [Sulfurimonas sp.]
MNKGERFSHLLKSFTIGDIGMIDKFFSFAVYTDRKINPQEYDAFIKILAEFFKTNGIEDTEKFKYIVEQVALNLENYAKNFQNYIEDKNLVLKFISDNKRDDIARAIYSIYVGDGELSKEESDVVQYFVDNLNIQFEE